MYGVPTAPMMQPAMAPVMQPAMAPVMQPVMQPAMAPVMQPGYAQPMQQPMQAPPGYGQPALPPPSDKSNNHLIDKEKKGLIKKLHDDPMGGLCCCFLFFQPLGTLCCLIADCNTCDYNERFRKALIAQPNPAGKWRKYTNSNLFYGDSAPLEAPQSNLIIHDYKSPVGTNISLDYGNPPIMKRLTLKRVNPDPIEDLKRIVEVMRQDGYTGFTVYPDYNHAVIRRLRDNKTLQPARGYDCQTYIYTPPGEPDNQGVNAIEPVYLS